MLEQLLPFFPYGFNRYHEPFVGGGAVFFELYSWGLLKNKDVYLSDINSELVNAYLVVRDKPDDLLEKLKAHKEQHSKEFYYKIRELDRADDFKNLPDVDRAARFIYLNKTCFNGLYRVNKKGYFNTPVGSYKNPNIVDTDTILNASEALQGVHIECRGFEEVINNADKGDLVYLDPPYYPLSTTSSFTSYDSNCFLEDEQYKLYEVFDKLFTKGCYVIESNSYTEFIKRLYFKFHIETVYANRSVNSKPNNRGPIPEVVIVGGISLV